ncbi:hypothetical protein SUGI_1059610 [Cryptomeria japonica]|uniref:ribonuclease 2 n=1 Tax=Cryptomeria japonica TaxID=3369 RepID=UPI002414CA0F|nr:ribonuclease 2 [Cryptomeria japonica]GLJ49863.1 hypothetical protein SUGI_1059610 [Cryptomeria japonica]
MDTIFSLIALLSFISLTSASNGSRWIKNTSASTSHIEFEGNETEKGFDYFVLALEWPGTICRNTHHCCSTNACCHGISSSLHFTIHGLWPDYNDGTWPQCCSGARFNEKKIFSLLGELERDWPSLSCSSPTNCHGGRGSLWAHEWEKHGTCSYPVIKDEYSYFSTTLQIYSKYNILDILNAAGISPANDKEYLTCDLVTAISKAVGATPSVVCSHGQLEELRLCFYKDFKPRDCISTYTGQNEQSCPQHVMIPQYVPSDIASI